MPPSSHMKVAKLLYSCLHGWLLNFIESIWHLIIHTGNMYYIERFFVGEEQKRAADVTEQVPLLCLNHHHHFSQRPSQGI